MVEIQQSTGATTPDDQPPDHITLGRAYGIKSVSTGKSATMNIHHHFKVRAGKITYFRGSEDKELVKGLLAG